MMRFANKLALVLCAWLCPIGSAGASEIDFQDHDVRSVFRIDKSENRNQVHYGIHLTEACTPRTQTPVYAYWHELERGPNVFLPLLPFEHTAYGIESQRIDARTSFAARVLLRMRALPDRELAVESYRDDNGACRARAMMLIAGQRAMVRSVFAQIGLLSVEYIRVTGLVPDGRTVQEIIPR